MEDKSIELIYEEHLKNEPIEYQRFYPEIKMGIETKEHIRWKIEKDNLELVKSIPKEKRIEALNLIKKGKTCGDVARELGIKDHMVVFYLINYNIEDLQILRSVSV